MDNNEDINKAAETQLEKWSAVLKPGLTVNVTSVPVRTKEEIDQEINKWAEVYPIDASLKVDLNPIPLTQHEGAYILPANDFRTERNTRKANDSTVVIDMDLTEAAPSSLSPIQQKIEGLRSSGNENRPKLKK